MDNNLIEKKLTQSTVYTGPIFKVEKHIVKLPNEKEANRDIVVNPNATAVVAIDDEQNVILVRQYRVAAGKILQEIPAGKIDTGETPLECANRELKEETGYTAKKIELLFAPRVSPGFSTERIYIYLASELTLGDVDPDEDEFVEVIKIPLIKLVDMVMNNEIEDGKTISGVLAAARILKV